MAKDGDLVISELRYRRLFDTAQDGILLLNFETGMIDDVNKFLIDMLGYSKEELLTKHLWEIGFFKNEQAQKENLMTLQEKGYVRFEDLPLETKTGKKINVEFVANAYKVDKNTVIQCNVRDITDRVRAEEIIKELSDRNEAILGSIGDAAFACDIEGKIILFNKMAEELVGISTKEALGHKYREVIVFVNEKTGKPGNDFIAEAIAKEKPTAMINHTLLLRKDGKKLPVADSAAPIINSEGKVTGCVVVFRNVTKERSIDRAKTELVSLASHQLRTPLTAIGWYSELLQLKKNGVLNEKQTKLAEEIYSANKRMTVLVNSLLNVSRIEMGTFIVEPVILDLMESVRINLNLLSPQIKKKNLIFTESYEPGIKDFKADPKLLGIIMQNLFSNSIKYTPKNGKISLSIIKTDGEIKFAISDTGIGIPKHQQIKVFNKLFRADNANNADPDGTGLGLYIVKEIVESSGGRIWFDSEEGKGTTFFVTYPLSGMSKKNGDKTLIFTEDSSEKISLLAPPPLI